MKKNRAAPKSRAKKSRFMAIFKGKSKAKSKARNRYLEDKPGFFEWLIHGKGSVAEPWRTPEEVLQDPAVQKEIQGAREAFYKHQTKNKKE